MDELSQEKKKLYKRIRLIIQIIVISIVLIGITYLTIKLFPIVLKIQNDEEYRNLVIDKI